MLNSVFLFGAYRRRTAALTASDRSSDSSTSSADACTHTSLLHWKQIPCTAKRSLLPRSPRPSSLHFNFIRPATFSPLKETRKPLKRKQRNVTNSLGDTREHIPFCKVFFKLWGCSSTLFPVWILPTLRQPAAPRGGRRSCTLAQERHKGVRLGERWRNEARPFALKGRACRQARACFSFVS